MTKMERQKIIKALNLLNSQDGFQEGMDLLSDMIGLGKPFEQMAKSIKPTSIQELVQGHNQSFDLKTEEE